MEEKWRVWFEEEEAKRAVRKCAVRVMCIVPVVQSGQIPMNAPDEGITGIVSGGKGEEISYIDHAHDRDCDGDNDVSIWYGGEDIDIEYNNSNSSTTFRGIVYSPAS